MEIGLLYDYLWVTGRGGIFSPGNYSELFFLDEAYTDMHVIETTRSKFYLSHDVLVLVNYPG